MTYVWVPEFKDNFLLFSFSNLKGPVRFNYKMG